MLAMLRVAMAKKNRGRIAEIWKKSYLKALGRVYGRLSL